VVSPGFWTSWAGCKPAVVVVVRKDIPGARIFFIDPDQPVFRNDILVVSGRERLARFAAPRGRSKVL